MTYLKEDAGNNVVDLANELEHRVVGEVLEGELALSSVARVGLAEDGVAVTGDDLATLESGPDVVTDSLVGCVLADLGLHAAEPDQNLLVGKTVEGTRKTVQGRGESKEGVGQSGANKLAGVGRHVTALVITVNGDVKTQVLGEVIVITESKHIHVVPCSSVSIPLLSHLQPIADIPTKSRSLLIFGRGFPGLYTLR